MKIRTIGFIGGYQVGKSTTAIELGKRLGFDYLGMGFADEIRSDLEKIIPPSILYSKPYSTQLRSVVQSYGEWAKSHYGDLYWLERLESKIGNNSSVTIGDVRFLHEAKWIIGRDGILVHMGDICTDYEIPEILDYCEFLHHQGNNRPLVIYAPRWEELYIEALICSVLDSTSIKTLQ